jgi:hypothetical protein
MCILVGECPPIGKFSVNYFGWMEIDLRLGSINQCKWMTFQLVHEFIGFSGFGLT